MISLDQKTAPEIAGEVAAQVRARRKEHGLTQAELARKAGMSLTSYKRFEQKGLIAFAALIRIAIALDCENDFDTLFATTYYRSIEDVIAARERSEREKEKRLGASTREKAAMNLNLPTNHNCDNSADYSPYDEPFVGQDSAKLAKNVRRDMVYAEAQEYGLIPDDSVIGSAISDIILGELELSADEVESYK